MEPRESTGQGGRGRGIAIRLMIDGIVVVGARAAAPAVGQDHSFDTRDAANAVKVDPGCAMLYRVILHLPTLTNQPSCTRTRKHLRRSRTAHQGINP